MADKLNLPKAKFSHELTPASVEPTMKAAEATSAKLYRVPVDKITTIPGFNVRVESEDYLGHVDSIRASIAANGYDSTKPLAGYVAKEGDENVIYVTDGHTRLAAVRAFNESVKEKNRILALPVMVHAKEISLTDLTVGLQTANSGRGLTPYEQGVVAKRLLAEDGAEKPKVAERLGITTRYLDNILLLVNADSKVRQHVASGAVSSTLAIDLLRKDADTAAEKIEALVKKTEGTGKKATKKAGGSKLARIKAVVQIAEGEDMKSIVKAAAAAIREAVKAEPSEDDEDVLLAVVDGTITLNIEVPAAVAEEKPAKKAKGKDKAKGKGKAKAEKVAEEKPAKKGKGKAKKDDLGIDGAEAAEGEDDEIAKLPPKAKGDEGDADDVEI